MIIDKIYQKIKKMWQQSPAGFTIMETILVLAIFSIATTYSISIFVQSNNVQKRTANIQRLTADARYVLEVMAREVRMGEIDYSYSGYTLPLTGPQTVLAIKDEDNQPIKFRRGQTGGRFAVQVCSGDDVYCQSEVNWLDITSGNLTVERLAFYLAPPNNPFSWQLPGYYYDEQPRATIILETKSLYGNDLEQHLSHFQTTVSSRSYQR